MYARESVQLLDRMRAELAACSEGIQGHVCVWGSKSAVAQFLSQDYAQRSAAKTRIGVFNAGVIAAC